MIDIMTHEEVLEYIAKNHKLGIQIETILYKGYIGTIQYDTEDLIWHGKVLLINDLIVYKGYDKISTKDAFESMIDDYIYDLTTTFGEM